MAKRGDDKTMVADILDKHRQRNNRVWEKQWQINLAFYLGNQYVAWNRVTNRLMPLPPGPGHRVRLTVNQILPAVQMAVGRLIKNKPKAEVIPPDGSEEKVNVAKVATKVLDYRDRVTNQEKNLQKFLFWSAITGTSFLKHTWNPDLGQMMTLDGETMPQGDEETTVCSSFEVCADPLALDVQSAHWMMHYRLQHKGYVKRMWGIEVDEEATGAQDMFGLMDMRLVGDAVLGGVYMPPKGVLVREYWERPNDEYPDGRLVILAGEKVAYSGKNYMGELPFVRMPWFEVPNSFWARGIVDDMIPLQKNYNRRRSQIAENANLMSNPLWLADMGAFKPGKEPTNAPNQIVEIVPGMNAQMMQPPALPAQVYQDMSTTKEEMGDVSGVREVGPGMLPPGVRAAAALALVNEMMQTQSQSLTDNLEYAVRDSARMRIKLIKMFYSTPRDIHVAGPNRSYAVEQFKGADLDDEFDISIQAVSGLPQDKTARSQLLQNLLQLGVIDKMKYTQLMELSDIDEVWEDMQQDVNAAEWENDRMKSGKSQAVHDYENHQVHIYEHNRFRKSEAYKKLSPKVQALFEMHVRAHEQYLQMQQSGQSPDAPQTEQQAASSQQSNDQAATALLGGMAQQVPTQGGGYNPASGLEGGMTNVNNQLMHMQG